MEYRAIIEQYFSAWLSKDAGSLRDIFAANVIYSECCGPEYRGLNQIERWFADWNLRGTVLQWDIKNVIACGSTACADWYFCCEYDGVIDSFDGISWIEFDEHGRICALREFQSKAEHCFPYE